MDGANIIRPAGQRCQLIINEDFLTAIILNGRYAAEIILTRDVYIHILIEKQSECNGAEELTDTVFFYRDIALRRDGVPLYGNRDHIAFHVAVACRHEFVYHAICVRISAYDNSSSIILPLAAIHSVLIGRSAEI